MSKNKTYRFNPQTLSYEVVRRSRKSRFFKTAALFVVSLCMTGLYFWIYSSVLGFESPKTALLKKENAAWISKIEVLDRQLDEYDDALETLQMRDDDS